jgi:hypothetical protein
MQRARLNLTRARDIAGNDAPQPESMGAGARAVTGGL